MPPFDQRRRRVMGSWKTARARSDLKAEKSPLYQPRANNHEPPPALDLPSDPFKMESDPEDEDAAAMAAAMGFSSFGPKAPAKKRKFNATTDAFVEGQELEKIDRGGKKGTGSGGNTIPLGKMRVFGQSKEEEKSNKDETDLDTDEDDGAPLYEDTSRTPPAENEHGPRYMDPSLPPPIKRGGDGPAYIDTSEEAPTAIASGPDVAEKAAMQARIDALLASIQPAPPPGSDTLPFHSVPGGMHPPPGLPSRAAFSDIGFMQGRPRGGSAGSSPSSSRGGRGGGHSHGGRQHNERWYEGYYDPSFNENPWTRLEKAKGLESVGTWVERERR